MSADIPHPGTNSRTKRMLVLVDNKHVATQGSSHLLLDETNLYMERLHCGDIYFHHGWKRLDGKLLEDFDTYRYNFSKTPSLIQGFLYDHHHLSKNNLLDSLKYFTVSKDKTAQNIFLERNGYHYPESMMCMPDNDNKDHIVGILQNIFEYPYICKYPEGARGEDVFLISSLSELEKMFYKSQGKTCIFQQFISNDGDFRVVVVGDSVLGIMKRYNATDFRNNVSLGGSAEMVCLPKEVERLCINITKGFGLSISGIDLIYDGENYNIIEINDMPDNNLFAPLAGINVDQEILRYMVSQSYREIVNLV